LGVATRTKTGGNSNDSNSDNNIDKEYNRWLRSQEVKKIIDEVVNREIHNIIERWFITNVNNCGDAFMSSDESDAKLISECKEKHIGDAQSILDRIKSINIPADMIPGEPIIQFEPRCQIVYKKFTFDITPERLTILRKSGSDKQILRAALRYTSLLPRGQQWAIPLADYKKYVADGATIEGFASPFNSQIIRLGDYKFCSLFPDTDSVFGSIGNFFTREFKDQHVVVNPPFVESILSAAADKCISELSKYKCKFVFYGPTWTDAAFFQKLSTCDRLIEKKDLSPGEYYYEDLFSNRTIKASFGSTIWTLSSK
jgi:hypothetical protein